MTEYIGEPPAPTVKLIGVDAEGNRFDLGDYAEAEMQANFDMYLSLYERVIVVEL